MDKKECCTMCKKEPVSRDYYTAKKQYQKFETNIHRKGICLPILLQENMWADPGNIYITHRHMNVEIGLRSRNSQKKNT